MRARKFRVFPQLTRREARELEAIARLHPACFKTQFSDNGSWFVIYMNSSNDWSAAGMNMEQLVKDFLAEHRISGYKLDLVPVQEHQNAA